MSFKDLSSQRHAVHLLQRSLERGRLGHGYLFSGNEQEELELVARTLAKTLNCTNPEVKNPLGSALDSCDQCSSCRKTESFNHPDVQWVRPESKSRVITIEQIRELMHSINLKPTEAGHKVAVIVAADRLNIQAANAFLKTLEEPPARSVIILLTSDPQRILETILSRCLRLNFSGERDPAKDRNAGWLTQFSELTAREHKGLLSRYRLLGGLLRQLGELRAESEKELTKRSPIERYEDVDPKLREKWEDELSAAIEAEYRHQRLEVLLTLEWWLRDIWLMTLSATTGLLAYPKLEAATRTVAARLGPGEACENLRILEGMQRSLATNVQEALALEVGLLKLKL